MDVEFKLQQNSNSIIMVAGVGGGGCSAVSHLYSMNVTDVSFMIINTDSQALQMNAIPLKIQLGDGLGAGNNPQRAKTLAEQSEEAIKQALEANNTKMLFVTAGMGGGTGTGASPVVARIAREMDILTVGIVSIPYMGEGPKRAKNAVEGVEELLKYVDSLIVIDNEHIEEIYGDLGIEEAHAKADDILAMAAKNISDIISNHMAVNVDFADIKSVMRNQDSDDSSTGKIVLMGSAEAQYSEQVKAVDIAQQAVNSPLLHHNDINGAKNILYNISYGSKSVSYSDSRKVMDFLQEKAGLNKQADLIWGAGRDESMGDNIRVTVIATGYDISHIPAIKDHFSEIIDPSAVRQTQNVVQREVVSIDGTHSSVSNNSRMGDGDMENGFGIVTHPSGGSNAGSRNDWENTQEGIRPVRIEPNSHRAQTTNGVVPNAITGGGEQYNEQQRVISGDMSPIVESDSDSSMEKPAYLRRGVSLYSEQRGAGATRETLDTDKPNKGDNSNVISLFD